MRGADADTVRAAYDAGDPLPGTAGFAGPLPGVGLVRDVLGREPLFVDAAAADPTDGAAWATAPGPLDDPRPVPPGGVVTPEGRERAWSLPDPAPDDAVDALDGVRNALDARLGAVDADAVALSGGVDSALLAAALDRPCYVVGFPGAHDLTAAREAAERLDRELRVVEVDHDDLRRAVRAAVAATGRTNAMDVPIGALLHLVGERAAADGHERLALGQGADELFGGYAKVAALDDRVAADSVRGAVRETVSDLPDGLERDVVTLRAAGVDPVFPYLHDTVVEAALELPADLLVDGDERKVALRRVARERVGDLADRGKKAAQYGSYVARELDRLARRAGYKRRMDDHVRRYVESVAASDAGEQ
ncbi:MAG: asparagine synthase C-terminal domain-containing protein [Haloferacaceae archaeon]